MQQLPFESEVDVRYVPASHAGACLKAVKTE